MSSIQSYKLILVTGCPRSGTTAIGKVLSFGKSTSLLYEPFNRFIGLKGINTSFMIPGIEPLTETQTDSYYNHLKKLNLSYKKSSYKPHGSYYKRKLKKIIGERGIISYYQCKLNPWLETIIWKDPIAVFFSGYLLNKSDIQIVVTTRSPLAVAGSFKRLNWSYSLEEIFNRVIKINPQIKYLSKYIGTENSAKNSAILWTMIYSTILYWIEDTHRSIYLVNPESILQNPLLNYNKLYSQLSLNWNKKIGNKINKFHSNNQKGYPSKNKTHDFRRYPDTFNTYYKKILTDDEYHFINSLTSELWASLKASCFI